MVVYSSQQEAGHLTIADNLESAKILPGFNTTLAELF